jgi:predicted transglutaminase-like cysteine proteinase
MEHFGIKNAWYDGGDGFGDCKSHALVKWVILRWLGIPARLAEVQTFGDELHMVVLVGHNFVLDNGNVEIRPLSTTGLSAIAIQSADDPRNWENAP